MSDQERCAPGCGKTTAEMGPGEFWGGYFHVDADLPTRAGLMPLFCTAACLDRAKASQPEKPRREPVAPWVRFVDGVAPGVFGPVDATWELPPGLPVPATDAYPGLTATLRRLAGQKAVAKKPCPACNDVPFDTRRCPRCGLASKAEPVRVRLAPVGVCKGPLATHGTPVLRVTINSAHGPEYLCDACYLDAEREYGEMTEDEQARTFEPAGPRARVGTVPQSVGSGAGIGIWASRGMRSK